MLKQGKLSCSELSDIVREQQETIKNLIKRIEFLESKQPTVNESANFWSKFSTKTTSTEKSLVVNTIANSIISEQENKKKRENNIIIFGIPESIKIDESDTINDDKLMVNEIFDYIGKSNEKPIKLIRLKKKKVSKNSSPIIAVLPENCERNKVQFASRELRNNDNYNNVYLNPDMTPAERLIDFELRKEKKKKTSTLPQIWKDADIIPISKKGDKKLVTNYRPISLTCTIVKIFEKIIQKHIFIHLLKNNLLTPSQHGFYPGRSCETNLLTVINTSTLNLDKGLPVDNIYLDFEKAFDKVPPDYLLLKLKAYGINGSILSWIRNFLTNRRQRVMINGNYSDWVSVKSGVPQGSVLSALLFIIYVNDIPNIITSNAALFADDTKIFYPITNLHSHTVLQNDIDILVDWVTK
ncbi:uncharacterized protein LOC136086037 [Hydra vulgaris]|uniref:uncharacterized protein LOC136086037 n=1 Tax=Hydra vulgaris TaxID=6087 RepID=UPI0032E9E6DE